MNMGLNAGVDCALEISAGFAMTKCYGSLGLGEARLERITSKLSPAMKMGALSSWAEVNP